MASDRAAEGKSASPARRATGKHLFKQRASGGACALFSMHHRI
jgi:hypothetical protein